MNGQRRSTGVFPSPSKIPYGGFSPVRLQTEFRPPPSTSHPALSAARIPSARQFYKRPKSKHPDHVAHRRANRSRPGAPGQSGTIPGNTGHIRPEALGSPAGYAVLPDQRLLWPHPSLSPSSTHLCIRGWLLQPRGLPRAENERVPNLLLVSVPSCRPPYPSGPDGCLWLYFAIRSGLRHLCIGSASTSSTHVGSSVGGVTRLQGSFQLLRPEGLLALHRQGLLLSSFRRLGHPRPGVEDNYAGKQPIPAAGLPPARNKALWAANRVTEAQRRKYRGNPNRAKGQCHLLLN
jgi:hypothetical protein